MNGSAKDRRGLTSQSLAAERGNDPCQRVAHARRRHPRVSGGTNPGQTIPRTHKGSCPFQDDRRLIPVGEPIKRREATGLNPPRRLSQQARRFAWMGCQNRIGRR